MLRYLTKSASPCNSGDKGGLPHNEKHKNLNDNLRAKVTVKEHEAVDTDLEIGDLTKCLVISVDYPFVLPLNETVVCGVNGGVSLLDTLSSVKVCVNGFDHTHLSSAGHANLLVGSKTGLG